MDRYRLEEIEIENYNKDVQDYYFSLDKESGWNSGVAFCINQDDEIQVRYNFTKSKYYKKLRFIEQCYCDNLFRFTISLFSQ